MHELKTRSFKDLIVWQRSMELVNEIYRISSLLPSEEKFGLTSQMRRSVISIPSNISEGYRRGTREFIHFLSIADGSASELETQILVLKNVYTEIDTKIAFQLLEEVQKMIGSLINKLIVNH